MGKERLERLPEVHTGLIMLAQQAHYDMLRSAATLAELFSFVAPCEPYVSLSLLAQAHFFVGEPSLFASRTGDDGRCTTYAKGHPQVM